MTPLQFLSDLFYSVYPVVYFTAAGIFVLVTILEKWVFAFHPLQKDIFIDQDTVIEERNSAFFNLFKQT